MRKGYLSIIIFFAVLFFGLFLWLIGTIFSSYNGSDKQQEFIITILIQALSGIAVAAMTVATVATIDKKKKKIVAGIEIFTRKAQEAKNKDIKVIFKITNKSNFGWVKPYIMFELPPELRFLVTLSNGTSKKDFSSNLHNSLGGQVLEGGDEDSWFIANNNLPYIDKGITITIWIRMELSSNDNNTYPIRISINAEDAQGITIIESIIPRELRNNKTYNILSSEVLSKTHKRIYKTISFCLTRLISWLSFK